MYLNISLFLVTNSARHQQDYLQRKGNENNKMPRKRQHLNEGAITN